MASADRRKVVAPSSVASSSAAPRRHGDIFPVSFQQVGDRGAARPRSGGDVVVVGAAPALFVAEIFARWRLWPVERPAQSICQRVRRPIVGRRL